MIAAEKIATINAESLREQPVLDHSIAETERKLAIENQAAEFEYTQRLAKLFAKSGCFQDIKKNVSEEQALAQAFTKIELGKCMGFSPAESMQGVHLIQGTPSVNAQLRASRMQRAGFSWDIDWIDNADGFCEGCRLWLYRYGKPLLNAVRNADGTPVLGEDGKPVMRHVSVSFTKKDAQILMTKIWDDDKPRTASVLEKDNWKGSPRNMYFARAITNAQRFHAPGVLSGEIPSTEEAMDFVDPDEQFKYGGSRDAQVAVMNEKLAQYAMQKIAEEREPIAGAKIADGVITVKAIPETDIPHSKEKEDGQKPQDAAERETPVSDIATQTTGGTTVKSPPSPAAVPEQSKPQKPVFGKPVRS